MILVTGASKGIGKAISEHLANKGRDVLGLARNVDGLDFNAMACDVSQAEQLKAIATHLKKKKVKVTGLINAAGIASMNLAVTTPASKTEQIIQTNLLGTIYSCQIFAPLMMRNKVGRIINFSTIAVHLGLKGESVYVASKAGIEGFSRSFAREMADFNITVNCIAPGPVATDLIQGVQKEKIQNLINQQSIARQFTIADVCDLVDLILDDKSAGITGQTLNLGGI